MLILFLLSIYFFYFILKKLTNNIDLQKYFKTYLQEIKNLNKQQSQALYINTLDKITVSGTKLLFYFFIYLTPSIPLFYFLTNLLNLSFWICIAFISTLYLLFYIKKKYE